MNKSKSYISFETKHSISHQNLEILISSAMQSSKYWMTVLEYFRPKLYPALYTFRCPLVAGGYISIQDKFTSNIYKLNSSTIKRGLVKMSTCSPLNFSKIIHKDGLLVDGDTADIFLQYCLLGCVLYG